jgi:hypothetical protein
MLAKQMIARHIHHGEEAFYVLEGATVVTRMRHSDRMLGGLFLTACQIGSLDTWFRLRDPFLDRSIAPRVPPR